MKEYGIDKGKRAKTHSMEDVVSSLGGKTHRKEDVASSLVGVAMKERGVANVRLRSPIF